MKRSQARRSQKRLREDAQRLREERTTLEGMI
jgi:hypothetical protein